MELCITAPKVKPTQFSASRLHIQMGRDFLQAGLTVSRLVYLFCIELRLLFT